MSGKLTDEGSSQDVADAVVAAHAARVLPERSQNTAA